MKKTAVILSLILAAALTGCSSGGKTQATPVPTEAVAQTEAPSANLEALTQNKRHIEIELEDGRKIDAEIYPDLAPLTVENFIKLINEHFYDGLIFHRVIPGFMIQGGGYDADGNHKDADSIKGEFASNGVENNLKHSRGVLSMARTMFPNSASSQFFIMHEDAPHLDGQYAAFGMVTDGMDVVDEIAETATDMQDKPIEDQIIKTIRRI